MKHKSLIIIIVILAIGLIFQTISHSVAINKLNISKKLTADLKDSLKAINKQLFDCQDDFHFKHVECVVLSDNKIMKLGDSLKLQVGLLGSYFDLHGKPAIERSIILGKGFDTTTYKLTGKYDSILTKDWVGYIKIKPKKIGHDTIFGSYSLPVRYGVLTFVFSFPYSIVK
jgi:hypothetical protein